MKTARPKPPPQPEPVPEPDPADDDELVVELTDRETEDRYWIGVLLEVLGHRRREPDHDPRVQFALNCAAVAAAERIGRICGADLDDGEPGQD